MTAVMRRVERPGTSNPLGVVSGALPVRGPGAVRGGAGELFVLERGRREVLVNRPPVLATSRAPDTTPRGLEVPGRSTLRITAVKRHPRQTERDPYHGRPPDHELRNARPEDGYAFRAQGREVGITTMLVARAAGLP